MKRYKPGPSERIPKHGSFRHNLRPQCRDFGGPPLRRPTYCGSDQSFSTHDETVFPRRPVVLRVDLGLIRGGFPLNSTKGGRQPRMAQAEAPDPR